jgi:hypothetical protein
MAAERQQNGEAAVKASRQGRAKKGRGVLLRDITPADILVMADKVNEERGFGWRDAEKMARGLAYLKWASYEQVSAFAPGAAGWGCRWSSVRR